MIRQGQANISRLERAQQAILQTAVTAGGAGRPLAVLQNEIAQGDFAASMEVPVELTDLKKTQFSNSGAGLQGTQRKPDDQAQRPFSLIQGQCTQNA
jgi:hypothetical protein